MTAPWVHASVPSGSEEFKEHAGFIRHTAMAGMIGLSFIPAALALKDHFTSVDAMVFALLASPLALATLVSRSGKLEMGKTAALACFALMIGVLVGATGGPGNGANWNKERIIVRNCRGSVDGSCLAFWRFDRRLVRSFSIGQFLDSEAF